MLKTLGKVFTGLAAGAMLMAGAVAPAAAQVEPQAINFRTPFDCGQVWNANTRTNHNPQNAVDFQRSGAQGKNVRSSAPGKVTTVRDLGNTSYGKYIVVTHSGGWQTLYAHLSAFNTSVGRSVSTGTIIGKVGNSGGSSGPHLHYEQKLNGSVRRVVLNGLAIKYFGNTTVTSSTGC
ncbi:M23 family metallopeptidase [Amycolatopsis suaedae]|uniref:M23 family metallopeptidase n=1 Tax=Amycolatopsis suaedae TaxID=2510978 RepID=A0A4Q7J6A7_9PSEU|nr:M23 family metallopeptidase [Amycolatopsis suaedae]RZQ61534.1 M23 family metallopeptidase [Amycolatopsis suaedae]